MSAPAICVVAAQPPTPPASSSTTTRPATMWRRMESRGAALRAGFMNSRQPAGRSHLFRSGRRHALGTALIEAAAAAGLTSLARI